MPRNQVAPLQMPNLPGYNNSNTAKAKPKSSGFQMVNGIRMNKQEDHNTNGAQDALTHREADASFATEGSKVGSMTSREEVQNANPDKVHRFFAYYKESVNESYQEKFRTRKVVMMFYADGTLEINEPKVMNSGIPQGCFLKRGAVPPDALPNPADIQLDDKLTIFGRTFVIYATDEETQKNLGDTLGTASGSADPTDKYTEERLEIAKRAGGDTDRNFGKRNSALKSFMEASLGNSMQRGSNTRSERKAQFLQNANKVLRFFCEYDNSSALYGDLTHYTLNYFLADDTVEIKEVRQANSGRDPFPLLLSRQKLPANWGAEGVNDRDRGVELDNGYEVYVTADDIQIGASVECYGRVLQVVGCDASTRSWYTANADRMLPAGWSEQPANCGTEVVSEALPTAQPADYNGYGTEQDSMGSVTHLIPKVPKKDFSKFMNHSTTILRFKAKFAAGSCKQEHASREFIISYFPSDDTQSIFETGQRNSGIVAGKFLERGAYKGAGGLYSIGSFTKGAELAFNSHRFVLEDCDESSKNSGLMDDHGY